MSKKEILVVFNKEGGARIEKDSEYISLHKDDENVLLNPEIPEGSSPSHWVKNGDKIEVNTPIQPPKFYKYSQKDEKIQKLEKSLEKQQRKNKINKYIITILSIALTLGLLCHLHS